MLIIAIKEGEENNSIDKILKKYKRRVEKAGVLRKMKQRKFFVKKSVLMRVQKQRATYIQHLKEEGLYKH